MQPRPLKPGNISKSSHLPISRLKTTSYMPQALKKADNIDSVLSHINLKKQTMHTTMISPMRNYYMQNIVADKQSYHFMVMFDSFCNKTGYSTKFQLKKLQQSHYPQTTQQQQFKQCVKLALEQSDEVMRQIQIDHQQFTKDKDLRYLIKLKQRLQIEEQFRRRLPSINHLNELYDTFKKHYTLTEIGQYLPVYNIDTIEECNALSYSKTAVVDDQCFSEDNLILIHKIEENVKRQVEAYNMEQYRLQQDYTEICNETSYLEILNNQLYQKQRYLKLYISKKQHSKKKELDIQIKYYYYIFDGIQEHLDLNQITIKKLLLTQLKKDEMSKYFTQLIDYLTNETNQLVKEAAVSCMSSCLLGHIKSSYRLLYTYLQTINQYINDTYISDTLFNAISKYLPKINIIQLKSLQLTLNTCKDEHLVGQRIRNFNKLSSFDREIVYTFLYDTLYENQIINWKYAYKFVNKLLNIEYEEDIVIKIDLVANDSEEGTYNEFEASYPQELMEYYYYTSYNDTQNNRDDKIECYADIYVNHTKCDSNDVLDSYYETYPQNGSKDGYTIQYANEASVESGFDDEQEEYPSTNVGNKEPSDQYVQNKSEDDGGFDDNQSTSEKDEKEIVENKGQTDCEINKIEYYDVLSEEYNNILEKNEIVADSNLDYTQEQPNLDVMDYNEKEQEFDQPDVIIENYCNEPKYNEINNYSRSSYNYNDNTYAYNNDFEEYEVVYQNSNSLNYYSYYYDTCDELYHHYETLNQEYYDIVPVENADNVVKTDAYDFINNETQDNKNSYNDDNYVDKEDNNYWDDYFDD